MHVPSRYFFVLTTFLLSVLLYVDRVCISAAKQPIADDLGLSETQMGWVLSAFALGYALFQTPGGFLADRFGPRRVLTLVVVFWSIFTGLTGAVSRFSSLVVARFFFGAGEAGAFPGIARATYSWVPMRERGIVQGINFSGSRLGAACALPVIAWMVEAWGWRASFAILMGIGFVWAVAWYLWFRDDPTEHARVSAAEREFILKHRQQESTAPAPGRLSPANLAGSSDIWLLCTQYFGSNFTFFFCLTWLLPSLRDEYPELGAVEAGLYAAAPFVGGAAGNWVAGWLVDRIYREGRWILSRRVPAIIGFGLAAAGVLAYTVAGTPLVKTIWFTVAIFGADMTLAPSWSAAIDLGGRHAGVVSGTMNMAGNVGSFVTALAFPYLLAWTDSTRPFFVLAACLSVTAAVCWLWIRPDHPLGGEDP